MFLCECMPDMSVTSEARLDHMKLELYPTDSDFKIQSLGLQPCDLDVRRKSGKHSATELFTQPQQLTFSNTIV